MERLTKRIDGGVERVCRHYLEEEKMCYGCVKRTACNAALFDRLAYYEDMEEQGRHVVLPAKQRSSVWLTEWWKNGFEWEKLSTPIERHIIYFSVEVGGVYAHFKEGSLHTKYFGKVAFLTREEAEQALKGGAN